MKQLDPLGSLRRTHYCGTLRPEHVGQEAVLCGWVHRRRDHGGVVFVDLRDRTGLGCIVDSSLSSTHSPISHSSSVSRACGVSSSDSPRLRMLANNSLCSCWYMSSPRSWADADQRLGPLRIRMLCDVGQRFLHEPVAGDGELAAEVREIVAHAQREDA